MVGPVQAVKRLGSAPAPVLDNWVKWLFPCARVRTWSSVLWIRDQERDEEWTSWGGGYVRAKDKTLSPQGWKDNLGYGALGPGHGTSDQVNK